MGVLELAEVGDTVGMKGPALFQAALGPRPPASAVFAAWPSLSAAPSFHFPTCWVEHREVSFLRPNVSLTVAF